MGGADSESVEVHHRCSIHPGQLIFLTCQHTHLPFAPAGTHVIHVLTRRVCEYPLHVALSGVHTGVEEGSFDVEFTAAVDSLRLAHFLTTAGRVSLCNTRQ